MSKLPAVELIARDAEDRWREAWAQLEAERDRYRIALTTISDADCPEAPISRETCARVASDALARHAGRQPS